MWRYAPVVTEHVVVSALWNDTWLSPAWNRRPSVLLAPARLVQIKTKKAKNGKELSMGFGFVELASLSEAKAAVKALQVCCTLRNAPISQYLSLPGPLGDSEAGLGWTH